MSRSRRQGLRTKRLGMGRDLRAARLVLGARPDPDPRRSQRQSRSRRLEPSSRSAGKDAGTAESEWGGTQSWSALEVQPDRGRDRSGSGRAPRMSELDRGAWVGTGARHSARPETEPETRPKPSGPQEPEAGRGPGPVPAPARGLELLVRGAESGRAEPARRAGSALGAGASAPETTRRQGVLRARRGACLRRHCCPGGRSLPEVVHLAEDFLVLDVAAVLLPQRRTTHGALEAPHVPDEVVDLGRGRRWGTAQSGPLFTPGPSLPGPICRYCSWRSEGVYDFATFFCNKEA